MFDADTTRLISSAPQLPGLDLNDLPRRLTDAYATLVSARIRLRELADTNQLPEEVMAVAHEMNRLAFSQEALVSASGDRENRAAAAFVAGAAHHVVLLAGKIGRASPHASSLSLGGISPEVSATILFLIAESSADAAEMAKSIAITTDDVIEASLLSAIVHLANGQLQDIVQTPLPDIKRVLADDPYSSAVKALYFMLLRGVRLLASSMLGLDARVTVGEQGDAFDLFERVKSLCIEPLDGLADEGASPYSVYPGPRHLASLLSAASKDLAASALVNTPAPPGLDGEQWFALMKRFAIRRPFLWRNHRQAISAGYLQLGVSVAISFPTGAGKSTLAELKIAAALLRGRKVVFLAPTLALVDQTASALRVSFPDSEVLRERTDDLILEADDDGLPAISVMTPERCLATLSFNRDAFVDVGLLVFDECHLLHPRQTDASRRSIDAMLSVLNFVTVAPEADLLFLSAMMMNTSEMAAWMAELTNRQCLPLTLTWKPTRQVRGCVVYGDEEIRGLNQRLREERARVTNKDAPAALKRDLTVHPYAFFCLHQTWQSQARKDYALLRLLDERVILSTGTTKRGDWYLTPNGNQVAAAIAAATAGQGLKTLIFTQTVTLANSAANTLSKGLVASGCVLSTEERDLYTTAVDEAGGTEHLYIQVDNGNRLTSSSACHHGLLLPVERNLHESLFRRSDGINVLVATSTLAQGMNLPSEVVIIGGDSRFDSDADRMQRLEAHELLNAAGRAGRAGDASYGVVLIVPSKVVNFDNTANRIHSHWADLRSIFAQSDQCLTIDDPLTALLDQIHDVASPKSDLAMYLLRRLPVSSSADQTTHDAPARGLLGRSFAAFRARQKGDNQWVQSRIDSALALRHEDPDTPYVLTWADQLAASAGIPVAVIRELGESFSQGIRREATMAEWYTWLVQWLVARPQLIPQLIRSESLEGLFGTTYKKLETDHDRGDYAAGHLFRLLDRWIAGDTLANIERAFGTTERRLGKCETAREFVLRTLPELSYIFGLPAQIYRAVSIERGERGEMPLALGLLGACVRQGFDNADKVVLRRYLPSRPARRAVHAKYSEIEPFLQAVDPSEDFRRAYRRIATAVEAAALF